MELDGGDDEGDADEECFAFVGVEVSTGDDVGGPGECVEGDEPVAVFDGTEVGFVDQGDFVGGLLSHGGGSFQEP